MDALEKAIKVFGSARALGEAIGQGTSTITNWKMRGNVPAEHCPAIERATRAVAVRDANPDHVVTCEELRPDVEWKVLREPGDSKPAAFDEASEAA